MNSLAFAIPVIAFLFGTPLLLFPERAMHYPIITYQRGSVVNRSVLQVLQVKLTCFRGDNSSSLDPRTIRNLTAPSNTELRCTSKSCCHVAHYPAELRSGNPAR